MHVSSGCDGEDGCWPAGGSGWSGGSCSALVPERRAGRQFYRDAVVAHTSGFPRLMRDLVTPRTNESEPLAVYIHGFAR